MSRLTAIFGAILLVAFVLHYVVVAQPMSPSKYYHMGPRLGKRNPAFREEFFRIPTLDREQVEAFVEGLQRVIAGNGEGKGVSRMRPEFGEDGALSQEN